MMTEVWAMIAAIAAAVAAIVSLYQTRQARQTFNTELFSKMIEELGSDTARTDRAVILKNKDGIKPSVQSMIKALNNRDKPDCLSVEMAIDRTIPRLDRVAYFLLGDKKKLSVELPPAWLWDILEDMWQECKEWIEYRRSPTSNGYYDRNYGRYFKMLYAFYLKNKPMLDERYAKLDKCYFGS